MIASRRMTAALIASAVGIVGLAFARSRRARRRRRTVAADAIATEARHANKVARIAHQLRTQNPGQPVSLHKSAPPHQVPKWGDLRRHDHKIDVSDLTEIIAIDPVARTCTAESGAMFEDVVAATLAYGLVPCIVPELASITIGGAVTGCSIESMSFRYGGFHDTCLAYEVITAEGNVLRCTPDEQGLVFQMMHGSFGTLGILAKLTFRLVPAKPFVRIVYERYDSVEALTAGMERHAAHRDLDMMDAIAHGPHEWVLAMADFVETAPYTHSYDWMRVYYRSTRERAEDYLRTEDYFFRYDRGVTSVHPSSWLGRLLLGKVLDSNTTLRLADTLHRFVLSRDKPTVTLDMFLPMSRVPEFLAWYRAEIGFFPLWCVPYRRVRDYEWLADEFYRGLKDELFLDIAIYGLEQTDGRNLYRMFEDKLMELGGVKTLIALNYYSRDEFWSIWNKRNYDAVKRVTDPANRFRDLYTKTCKAAMGIE